MVLDNAPEKEYEKLYQGKHHGSSEIYSGHEAARFFPTIGENGTTLIMTAAPVRDKNGHVIGAIEIVRDAEKFTSEKAHFDLMKRIARAEWDTLLFFYGVILCVGGLSQFGYLGLISNKFIGGCPISHSGQYTGDVCRFDNGSGDVPRSMASGNAYRRCGRVNAFYWFCCRRGPYGYSSWCLYFW